MVNNWLRHRNYFSVFFTIELLLEMMFTLFEVIYSRSAINDLYDVYGTKSRNVKTLYWILFVANLVYNVGYYNFGYYAI
jgi:hypothetical protein